VKAEKDKKTGKWLIQYRYTDWQGNRKKFTKRGFKTKKEAEEWLRKFLMKQKADFNMKFEDFLRMYYEDMKTRLREHTMRTKRYIIDLKILPYFGQKQINDINAADIRNWQNTLLKQGYGKFSTTADRVICIPQRDIDIWYIKHVAEPILRNKIKGRVGELGKNEFSKLTPAMIKSTVIPIPVKCDGSYDLEKQKELAAKYAQIEEIKTNLSRKIIELTEIKYHRE